MRSTMKCVALVSCALLLLVAAGLCAEDAAVALQDAGDKSPAAAAASLEGTASLAEEDADALEDVVENDVQRTAPQHVEDSEQAELAVDASAPLTTPPPPGGDEVPDENSAPAVTPLGPGENEVPNETSAPAAKPPPPGENEVPDEDSAAAATPPPPGENEVPDEDSAPAATPPPPGENEVPDENSTPAATPPPPEPAWNRSAPDWFRVGVDAYLAENWDECERALENAVVEWHFYRRANIECRVRCGTDARRAAPLYAEDVEHLHFVEEMVRATLCILKCKRRAFRGHATPDALPSAVQRTFRDLRPYEYLQLCYYQTQQTQKAASAVFTILSHDPNNEIMKHNLKYYLEKPEIDVNNIVNYEAEKFVSLYFQGTEAYYAEEYDTAISNLEASINEFIKANDECRADCEGPFDQGWLPDFTSSIANHFVYCLKCKRKCHSKLSHLNGEKYDNFLATHFDYLQFAYFKKGNLRKACAAAGTYLMFLPRDSTMLENVKYYKSLPDVDDSMFQPRPDIEKYIKRQSYEDALLTYIAHEFVFEEKEDSNEIPSAEEIYQNRSEKMFITDRPTKNVTKTKVQEDNMILNVTNSKIITENLEVLEMPNNHRIVMEPEIYTNSNLQEKVLAHLQSTVHRPLYNLRKENELGGAQRFVIDGLAEENECERLIQFAKASAVSGDGYMGNKSPHSPQENFEGVTLGKAALMMNFNLIEKSVLDLFLNLSERAKNIIASYFSIEPEKLYFSYTHLVCRSAIPGKSFNSSLYSHEIHADNCWMLNNGDCMKAYPAYYWRDYSAILYLNGNFKGGDFLFSADARGNQIQSSIRPKCGRLVGFSAGRENLHGVRGIEQGSRCALALWFTLDSERAEWGRSLAEQVVIDIENGQEPKDKVLHDLQKLVQFDLAQVQSQLLYKSSNNKVEALKSDIHQEK